MKVFLVALVEPNNGVWISIETEWSGRCRFISDMLALIAVEDVTTTREVREGIGIEAGSGGSRGIVVELMDGRFSGVLPTADVDWIRTVARDE